MKKDPTTVAEAMETVEVEAVSGKITFDAEHNPIKSAAILHVKDGQILFEASVAPAAPPTGGGPVNATEVLPTLAYRESFNRFNFGEGAAISVIMLAMLFVVALLYIRTTSEEVM